MAMPGRMPRAWGVAMPHAVALGLLTCHAFLLAVIAVRYSPTPDELAHIAGGVVLWEYHRFDLYCVNPPLTRLMAGLPAFLDGPTDGWMEFPYEIVSRPEFSAGRRFADSHPDSWRTYLVAARFALIPFSVLGGFICYLWAKRVYGVGAGVMALVLWCFSPMIMTWGALVGPDMVAASLGTCATYAFCRWLEKPRWQSAVLAGVALGLAQLAKFTLLIFFPLWMFLWCTTRFRVSGEGASRCKELAQIGGTFALAMYIINVGYAFTGTMTELGEFSFVSRILAGGEPALQGSGNRFRGSALGEVPVPVPKDYLTGIDLQRKDFEQGRKSYLAGEWSHRGWWSYYLLGILLKVPHGTLCLGAIAVSMHLAHHLPGRRTREGLPLPKHPASGIGAWQPDKVALIAVPVVLLAFVSSHTGFSVHFRYILPAFPFAFVWTSQVATLVSPRHLVRSVLIALLVAWSTASSLLAFPHSMSYFNIGAGPRVLLGSSFSWGQNSFFLKEWLDDNPLGAVPFVNLKTNLSMERLSIESRGPSPPHFANRSPAAELTGPMPGYHVVELEATIDPSSGLTYFSYITPDVVVADTIAVYHLDDAEANGLRVQLGLAPNPRGEVPEQEFLARIVRDAHREMNPKIALFSQEPLVGCDHSVPEELLACLPNAEWDIVDSAAIVAGSLDKYDVILVPGGRAGGQAAALGDQGRQAIVEYVRRGGGYVGICAGAFLGSSTSGHYLHLVNAECRTGTCYVPRYGNQRWSDRGGGVVQGELTDAGVQFFGPVANFEMNFAGGPIFSEGRKTYMHKYIVLAEYKSEVWRHGFQKGSMVGTPVVLAAPMGLGKVFLVGAHLEATAELRGVVRTIVIGAAR